MLHAVGLQTVGVILERAPTFCFKIRAVAIPITCDRQLETQRCEVKIIRGDHSQHTMFRAGFRGFTVVANLGAFDSHRASSASRALLICYVVVRLHTIFTPADWGTGLVWIVGTFVIGATAALAIIQNNDTHNLTWFFIAIVVAFGEFSFLTVEADRPDLTTVGK